MKLTQSQLDTLTDRLVNEGAIEDAEDVRTDYSGRGMYGTQCLGFVTDNPMGLSFYLGIVITELINETDRFSKPQPNFEDINIHDFSSPSSDSMGLSTIVYWPNISVEKE